MTAVLKKGETVLIEHVEPATSLRERMRGLLGRSALPAGHAMWIAPCAGVHTFAMRFPLDLVFLDGHMRVVRTVSSVAPRRVVGGGAGARSVLELQAGWFPLETLAVGDTLRIVDPERCGGEPESGRQI